MFVEQDQEGDNDWDVDDLLSSGGSSRGSVVTQKAAAERHSKLVEVLSTVSDVPGEKRSVRREGMLRRVFRALTQYATGTGGGSDVVHKFREDLLAACRTGMRPGGTSPAEQYASCRVLEALGVVLGADNDEHFENVEVHLRRVVMGTHRASLVRSAALRALALTNFMCATDEITTENLLDLCESVAAPQYRNQDVPPSLRATALDCWALLCTTLHDVYISGQSDVHTGRGLVLLELLQNCLESPSIELRAAAGECLAVVHESRWNVSDDDGENVTERKFARGSWEGTEWEDRIAEIQQRMAELSTESAKNISKRAKKLQRATFREFLSTLVDDEPPEETIHFRGGSLTVTSWREIVQLNFVRHCLQSGFQIQLLTNPTLGMIFGVDGVALSSFSGMSQVEKRLILSKGSEAAKIAHIDMTKKRRVRNNVKNHFLTADGDDI